MSQMDSLLKTFQRVGSAFRGLPASQKILYSGSVLILVASLGYLLYAANTREYAVLYSGLSQEELGLVVQKLKDQNIPYEIAGQSSISVPRDVLHETRLSLATDGIPSGGGSGFEIFDAQRLGSTDFVQKVNYQRALQGELARTINKMEAVEQSRVHLVMPEESLFKEDQKPPSASVVLKLRHGVRLSSSRVQGIVNLVSGAVPGLQEENITVLSTDGQVIFRKDSSSDSFLNDRQAKYKNMLEEEYRRKVQTMLEQLLGVNRVITRVSLDLDFNRFQETEELFDPDSAVVRSQQRSMESSRDRDLNPRGNPDRPVNLEGRLMEADPLEPEEQDQRGYNRQRETVNYEINRVSRQTVHAPGSVRNLSVAVMVDGPYEIKPDEDGKMKPFFVGRDADEMNTLEDLVRKAVGYDERRGDQITVSNVPFATDYGAMEGVTPENRWLKMLKDNQRILLNLLLIVLVFLFVVRPFMKKLQDLQVSDSTGREGVPALPGSEEGGTDLMDHREAQKVTLKQKAVALVNQDPKKASDVVRAWLREET